MEFSGAARCVSEALMFISHFWLSLKVGRSYEILKPLGFIKCKTLPVEGDRSSNPQLGSHQVQFEAMKSLREML